MRQIIVFDQGSVILGVQLGEEEVLDKPDLRLEALQGERWEWWRGWKERGSGGGKSARRTISNLEMKDI